MAEQQGQPAAEPFDPQAAILNIIQKEDAPAQPAKQEAAPEPQPEEPKEPEAEAAQPDADAEPKPEEPKVETLELDPDAPLFDIEIMQEGGKKEVVKHSLNDLKKQRMMQADYQRKTAELARQREGVQDEVRKAAEPKIQQAQQALQLANQIVMELVAPELTGLDAMQMANLASTDPARYTEVKAKQDLLAHTVARLQNQQQQLQQQAQWQQKQDMAKVVQESVAALEKDIPGWNTEYYQKVLKSAVADFGLKHEEAAAIYDPRVIKVLDAARKYAELQKAKPITDKKIVSVPKVLKPGTPSSADQGRAEKIEKSMKQLRKSGRVEDMANLLLQRGL